MPHYVEDVRQYAIIGRSLLYTFFENQDFSKPIIDLTNKVFFFYIPIFIYISY